MKIQRNYYCVQHNYEREIWMPAGPPAPRVLCPECVADKLIDLGVVPLIPEKGETK